MSNANSNSPELHPLIGRLLEQMEARRWSHVATYRMLPTDGSAVPPESVEGFLGLKKEELSPTASEALDALEHEASPAWSAFKWKLTAFTYVADIFDTPFHDSDKHDARLMLEQFYAYFESLRLLKESILCGLNGFTAASNALLRPFLEFSLLQNYFYRTITETRSFKSVQDYHANGIKPSATTLTRKALPENGFSKPIRFRITEHLGGLSETALHPYHPILSHAQETREIHAHSFESLYFWYTTRFVVDAALWVYYVNFPMLFSPVDIVRRFGCSGPIGVFIDGYGALAVEKSLGAEDYVSFRDYARGQEHTIDCMNWYDSLPVLTDEQIEATWRPEDGERFPGIHSAYAQSVCKTRTLKAVLAHRRGIQAESRINAGKIDTLSDWKALSKRRL